MNMKYWGYISNTGLLIMYCQIMERKKLWLGLQASSWVFNYLRVFCFIWREICYIILQYYHVYLLFSVISRWISSRVAQKLPFTLLFYKGNVYTDIKSLHSNSNKFYTEMSISAIPMSISLTILQGLLKLYTSL